MTQLNFPKTDLDANSTYTENGVTYIYDPAVNSWTGGSKSIPGIPGFEIPGIIPDAAVGKYTAEGCAEIGLDGINYGSEVNLPDASADIYVRWKTSCLEQPHETVIEGKVTHEYEGKVVAESSAVYTLQRVPNNNDEDITVVSVTPSSITESKTYSPTGFGDGGETTLVYGTTDSTETPPQINISTGSGPVDLPSSKLGALPVSKGVTISVIHQNSSSVSTPTTTTLEFTDSFQEEVSRFTYTSTTSADVPSIQTPTIESPGPSESTDLVPTVVLKGDKYVPNNHTEPHATSDWEVYETGKVPIETDVIIEVETEVGDWTDSPLTSAQDTGSWLSIAGGNNQFVAVDLNSSLMYSGDNGASWTTTTSTAGAAWRDITYGEPSGSPLFVAVSGNGQLARSTNGSTWTGFTTDNQNSRAVTFANGRFVKANYTGSKRFQHSTNGVTWTSTTSTIGDTDDWWSVAGGNGIFISVGQTNVACVSTDLGVTWARQVFNSGSNNFTGVAYGDPGGVPTFVVVSETSGVSAYYTSDGVNWNQSDLNPSLKWQGVSYGDGLFCAVSNGGSTAFSEDGKSWYYVSSTNDSNNWSGVAYYGDRFMAVASAGSGRAMYSIYNSRIKTLTIAESTNFNLLSVGNTVEMDSAGVPETSAITSDNTVTTTDGAFTYAESTPNPTITTYFDVLYAQNKWVACGNSDSRPGSGGDNPFMHSIDGKRWYGGTQPFGFPYSYKSLAYSEPLDRWVACGNRSGSKVQGLVWTDDPTVAPWWTFEESISQIMVAGSKVAWGYDKFLAFGYKDSIGSTLPPVAFSSPDGKNWTEFTFTTDNALVKDIIYAQGKWTAVLDKTNFYSKEKVMYSTTGTSNWKYVESTNDAITWNAIVYDGIGTYVAVGEDNSVMKSSDGLDWTSTSPVADGVKITDTMRWIDVTYGDGKFVAISSGPGTDQFMYSEDGTTWTSWDDPITATPSNSWNAINYGFVSGQPRYVCVSSSTSTALTYKSCWSDKATGNYKISELTLDDDTNLGNLRVGDVVTETTGSATGTITDIVSDPDPSGDNIITLSSITGDWTGSTSTVTGPTFTAEAELVSIDEPNNKLKVKDVTGRFLETKVNQTINKLNKTVIDPSTLVPPGSPSDPVSAEYTPVTPESTTPLTADLTKDQLNEDKVYYSRVKYKSATVESEFSDYHEFTTKDDFTPKPGDEYEGGYYAGQTNYNGTIYNLIVAPISSGGLSGEFQPTSCGAGVEWTGGASNATIARDKGYGAPSMVQFVNSSAAFNFVINAEDGPNKGTYDVTNATGTGIGGFNDWYVPSEYEMNTVYYYLKPTYDGNKPGHGANPNAVFPQPINSDWDLFDPTRTESPIFQSGGSEAFGEGANNGYWTATSVEAPNVVGSEVYWMIFTGGDSGQLQPINSSASPAVRAIRRVPAP